jgi:hypothetical protein
MKYSTFEGKVIDTKEIGHQHISNIYWFQKIFHGQVHSIIMDRINNEFNGEILPYKPHPKFTEEINYLENRGMLIWKESNGIRCADIIWNGHVIGEARHIEDVREDIINQLVK